MAESISSVRANETRDSASETQSDCDRCTGQASNDEDNNFAVKQDGKKISPEQTTSPNRKRGRNESEEDETNEELKRNERRAANRLSAFQSRQRRKSIIADLQKTVAQLSKDSDDQRKKNRERAAELEALRKENEVLRSQVNGFRGDAMQPASDSQKVDGSSMLMPGLNFPVAQAAGNRLSTNFQDTLSLADLSSIDQQAKNFLLNRNRYSLGQVHDQLRHLYPSQPQIGAAVSSHANMQDQMMGVLTLLSQIESTSNSSQNLAQREGSLGSIAQNHLSQPQIDATQVQHLMELLRRSEDGNKR